MRRAAYTLGLTTRLSRTFAPGQYSYFKTDDGINTMNLEQQVPFGYYRLDNRPGETLYLYFEMTSGKLSELAQDIGMTAVMKSKEAKKLDTPKPNKGYVAELMNPGFMDLYLMKEATTAIQPAPDKATIVFIRPQSFAKEMAFGIWGGDQFLGNLKGQTYFQINTPPGEHYFLAKSENFSVLKADVEAGKTYYVKVAGSIGWSQAHIKLLPVTNETAKGELKKWLDGSKKVAIDETVIDDQVQERLDLALPYIQTALKNVSEGKAEQPYAQ